MMGAVSRLTSMGVNLMTDGQNSYLWPTQIASFYGITQEFDARGQTVGVIAMDGGYDQADIDQALRSMQRPGVSVIPVSVNGVTTRPAGGNPADLELALDLQVLCGLIPGATIVVYFVGSDIGDIADAITQAALDRTYGANVLSISWGLREEAWTPAQRAAVETALQKASDAKMTVVAASGDGLATDGDGSNVAHVWFPASHPTVFACGGTELILSSDRESVVGEVVWNNPVTRQGSDGGISQLYPVPVYQQSVGLPVSYSTNRPGRGVPDFAAAAASSPGYRIVLNRKEQLGYGTSAATPLWAAVVAIANAKRGRPLGDFHDYLYGNPSICAPITRSGNNVLDGVGYYATGPSWNACTGLGVPKGIQTINVLYTMP
jgi:kumamolisin